MIGDVSKMNIYSNHLIKTDEKLRLALKELKHRHRDRNFEISSLGESRAAGRSTIKQVKVENLCLKDVTVWIEYNIYPDIIA